MIEDDNDNNNNFISKLYVDYLQQEVQLLLILLSYLKMN
jgi:hypothetical protein